jgi:hypothetical protein
MTDPRNEYVRQAIGVMAAWNEAHDEVSLLAATLITEAINAGVGETTSLLAGSMGLRGGLLFEVAKETGEDVPAVLQRIAARYS